MKLPKLFFAILIPGMLLLPIDVGAQRDRRATWPKKDGVYLAASSNSIPEFPRTLSGYKPTGNLDYWDHTLPFSLHGSTRLFESNGWEKISDDFPITMNHCSAGVWMIRWRSANPNVRIASGIGNDADHVESQKTGSFGYMQSYNCEQPVFKFVGSRDSSTLVDIYFELKFWRAAP
jgi:hypothetical protein